MSDLAPIVLFVYNRPLHTLKTLEALSSNYLADQSTLFIFADGPKVGASIDDLDLIRETRKIASSRKWCKEVFVRESQLNSGLADSIVKGVTEIVNKYGKIIVLEDDIVTSKGFLQYMNDALNIYEADDQVMHVSAYMYPVSNNLEEGTIFLKILSCWGWATWKRAWKHYSEDCALFLRKLDTKDKIRRFNIEGHAPFYIQLEQNNQGTIKTWAVKWFSSWYFAGGYSLFPRTTLVENIGHDGTGENSGNEVRFKPTLIAEKIEVAKAIPKVDATYSKLIDRFYSEIYDWSKKNKPSQKDFSNWLKRVVYNFVRQLSVVRILKKYLGNFIRSQMEDYQHYQSVHSNVKKGRHVVLYDPLRLWNVEIGDFSYINSYSHLLNVQVGRFTSIGPKCCIGWGIHPINGLSTSPMFYSTKKQNGVTLTSSDKIIEHKKIVIGNDVFIGMNVTILDGVTIGDGAVIGAGAIVSRDIPPYAIAVGNPVQIVKYRFPEETIKKLLDIKWWYLPEQELKNVEKYFYDVDEFIEAFQKKELKA
jgi:acetyltransferase-like isoleucine patch superfamily enzyme